MSVSAHMPLKHAVYVLISYTGLAHDAFGDNKIHDPDGKLVQQGEQTSVCLCKLFVA